MRFRAWTPDPRWVVFIAAVCGVSVCSVPVVGADTDVRVVSKDATPTLQGLADIKVGPDGKLWFACMVPGVHSPLGVGRLSAQGTNGAAFRARTRPCDGSPFGNSIALDHTGNVWFASPSLKSRPERIRAPKVRK